MWVDGLVRLVDEHVSDLLPLEVAHLRVDELQLLHVIELAPLILLLLDLPVDEHELLPHLFLDLLVDVLSDLGGHLGEFGR